MIGRVGGAALGIALAGAVGALAQFGGNATFRHEEHANLFPLSCITCHVGPVDSTRTVWPDPVSCATCHDGEVEPRVAWVPPTVTPASNLRFVHQTHARVTADSVGCAACHVTNTGPRGVVHRSDAAQCVSCHVPNAAHLEVADRECATCHVPLAVASRLTRERVAGFPTPLSHGVPGFGLQGHGDQRTAAGMEQDTAPITSCATCHAQDFCRNCHVNAPEVAAIQALASDPRSLVHGFTFAAPASHQDADFATGHRREANRLPARCATCHARPSCTACHVAPFPTAVAAMAMPAPDRAVGAVVSREPPITHTAVFREGHGAEATATPRACATCHARQDCLACHRPNPAGGAGRGDYHPTTFLARHPAAAYARQTTCADCHNVQQFCASCHQQAGLGGGNTTGGATYHDGKAAFFVGHGQAARQSLESCVSCHAERDCTTCHAAVGGRRFSPHGPNFDGERLRRRNPEMCIACHGRAIPTVNP